MVIGAPRLCRVSRKCTTWTWTSSCSNRPRCTTNNFSNSSTGVVGTANRWSWTPGITFRARWVRTAASRATPTATCRGSSTTKSTNCPPYLVMSATRRHSRTCTLQQIAGARTNNYCTQVHLFLWQCERDSSRFSLVTTQAHCIRLLASSIWLFRIFLYVLTVESRTNHCCSSRLRHLRPEHLQLQLPKSGRLQRALLSGRETVFRSTIPATRRKYIALKYFSITECLIMCR